MNDELQRNKILQRDLEHEKMRRFAPDILKNIPSAQGVYVIYDKNQQPTYVGRTLRGKRGLWQRLTNHYRGQSVFVREFLHRDKEQLRKEFMFRYIVIKSDRERALLEAYLIGVLCPQHVGIGRIRK